MYVLLTGTKKNAGDFLIAKAAKRLFADYSPCRDFLELPSWEPLSDRLDRVNAAKALILCGGPAYQYGLGKTIYPIAGEISKIKVPIVAFGLGWKGIPGDDFDVRHFPLSKEAEPLLDRIEKDHISAGCRDYLTCRMLEHKGLPNALMTGCPAWYDPDFFESDPTLAVSPTNILVTPAERKEFFGQSLEIMRAVRDLFPEGNLTASFHRGWKEDDHTSAAQAANALRLKEAAEAIGYTVVDVSGGIDGIDAYDRFDLHIGYRVHAHFKFLSMKRPTFLITEDGRGRGALEATNSPGVAGWRSSWASRCAEKVFRHPAFVFKARGAFGSMSLNPTAAFDLAGAVRSEIEQGYPQCRKSFATVEETWMTMRLMLESLPN